MYGSFIHIMEFTFNDGGRSAVFNTPGHNDCVVRALAIVTGRPYMEIWSGTHGTGQVLRSGRVKTFTENFKTYAESLGLIYVPSGLRLKDIEFPPRAVAHLHGHYVAIVDGAIQDAYNPSPSGLKTCIGYWMPKPPAPVLYNVFKEGRKLNMYPLNAQQAETMRALFKLNYGGDPVVKPA